MNVLLAIDDSPCSAAAVRAVINQFRPRDTTVRVVHVIEWPRQLPTALMFAEGPSAGDRVVAAHDEIRRRGRDLVAGAATRLQRARFVTSAHVVEGDPRDEILAMADSWPADAIVVGSHGRKGIERLFLGSVSDGVVRHATCSVLVVRSDERHLAVDQLRTAS